MAPLPGEPIVVKHNPDSFFETSLRQLLQENHIESLMVCGMMTHMCIDTTVRAARNFGYPVTLISDSYACRSLSRNGLTLPDDTVQVIFPAVLQRQLR